MFTHPFLLQSGLAGSLSKIHLSSEYKGIDESAAPSEDFVRQRQWERGQIDYMGSDSFANIQKKIDEAINARIAQ